MLSDLKKDSITVHLLYTDSSKLELLVYDTLKKRCEAGQESIFDVKTVSEFNVMLDMLSIPPLLANKWLVVLDYKRFASQVKKYPGIFKSCETALFLVKVDNYRGYLEFKEMVKGTPVNEMYLSSLSFRDVSWLLKGCAISNNLVDYVHKSYRREPDKILDLKKELDNGLRVESRRDIISVCGTGSSTVQAYAMSLLTVNVNTDTGASMSIRRKITEGLDLARSLKVGTFRNYLGAAFRDIIYIKEMYLNGDIYDEIRGIPEVFEEKKLMRYRVFLNRILTIPLEVMVEFYVKINESGYWYRESDFVSYLYGVYADLLKKGDVIT